jgi:Cu(I)/Ag(I) efflux system membrane fusion protein
VKHAPLIAVAAGLVLVGVAGGSYWLGTRASAAVASPSAAASAASQPAARKLLYYRNPMGLPDTSPTPKKDSMGMDYIAVYEGEDDAAGAADPGGAALLRIGAEKVQKLGVRTEAVALRPLGRSLRLLGRVEPDERRVAVIAPKFEGYVERLHVNATGQAVAKGQPLFEAYSPELLAAQREYLIAVQGQQALQGAGDEASAGMRQLADASLAHLRHWDLGAEDLAALVRGAEPRRSVTLRSPVAGVVTEKKALQGQRFMPGEVLYQITDLSAVWVIAELPEADLALAQPGARAQLDFTAFPGRRFEGRVTYVYPTLKPETRTASLRIELANPGLQLKPAMAAQVELAVGAGAPVLTVPDSAVIDSGTRRVVLVQRGKAGEGRFEPREVQLGARGDGVFQVLSGLQAGEQVVVSANFLLDAESNLKAALSAFTPPPAASAAASGSSPAARAPVSHHGVGRVEEIDAKTGAVTLRHEPIASLKWPAMTMEFQLANASLARGLKPGLALAFDFVERAPGEWVITAVTPQAAGASAGTTPAKPAPKGAATGAQPVPGGHDAHSGH